MASLIGLSEEAYTEAFTRHFKRTISFLHIKYRVPTAEAAEEYALEGWATVWQYRERFDPAKSSIETYANMCCFQAMVKRLLPAAKVNGADSADALAVAIAHAHLSRTHSRISAAMVAQ